MQIIRFRKLIFRKINKNEYLLENKYKKWRYLVFVGIFIGYTASYLVRTASFSLIMPHLSQYGITKIKFGFELTVFSIAYGTSKFLMGNISDKSNARYFLPIGIMGSSLIILIFGIIDWKLLSLPIIAILMFLNGWLNGMCYPPCSRVLANWFTIKERGIVMSIWNISHNLGGALVNPIAIYGIKIFNDWHSVFYFPAIIAFFLSFFVFGLVRDKPQTVGLPSIENYFNKNSQNIVEEKNILAKEIFVKHVLKNKTIWLLSISNIFVYFIRFGIGNWLPIYLTEIKHSNLTHQGLSMFLFEFAGIPSMILCGYLSNKLFNSRRTPIMIICMILITFAILIYWLNPLNNIIIDNILLIIIGFLIYGPVVLIGMQSMDVVCKSAVGTATGLTGFFGYVGGNTFANSLIGYIIQHFGWNYGFISLIISSIFAIIFLIPLWNVGGIEKKDH